MAAAAIEYGFTGAEGKCKTEMAELLPAIGPWWGSSQYQPDIACDSAYP